MKEAATRLKPLRLPDPVPLPEVYAEDDDAALMLASQFAREAGCRGTALDDDEPFTPATFRPVDAYLRDAGCVPFD